MYTKSIESVRSVKPVFLVHVLLLAQCDLAMLITILDNVWSTLIDILLCHANMGATASDKFTADVNTLVRQTALFPTLFAQLPHSLPSAFVFFSAR